MKKAVGITSGVVVVALAGWLGATWYTGKRIETEAPVQLAQLNKQLALAMAGTGHSLTLEQIAYDRHFFSTDVRYALKLTEPAEDGTLPEQLLELAGKIEHGPFAKGALARGHWLPELAYLHTELVASAFTQPVFELTQGASPLTADAVVSYNGDITASSSIAPIDFSQDTQRVIFSGARMQGHYTRADQHIVGSSTMDTLTLDVHDEEETVRLDIGGLRMELDTRTGKFGIGVGTSGFNVDHVTVDIKPRHPEADTTARTSEETGSNYSLKNLAYNGSLRENGDTLQGAADYKIGQLVVDGSDFGHGSFNVAIDRIDGKAAKALTDLYNQLLLDMSNDSAVDTSVNSRVIEATNQVIQLLAAKPTLRVGPVIWQTPQGQSRLNLSVDLTKPESLRVGQQFPSDYRQLIQQAIALVDLKISLSKPMMQDLLAKTLQNEGTQAELATEEAAEQVASLAGLAEMFGVAKTEGDNLVGTFHYADGRAVLNGEEFPLEDLFDSMFGGWGDDIGMDARESNAMLEALDPAAIGEMVDNMGYDYELGTSDEGTPVLQIDGSDDGAQSITIDFNDCESPSACSDMSMRATVQTPRAVSMRALNDWNQNHGQIRAYWDADSKVAVMEMAVNAYGGIGQSNVQYSVRMFLANVLSFSNTMTSALVD